MYITEKYKRLGAALNAAYIQNDDAAIDAAYASMDKLRCVMENMAKDAEVVHYDFCTQKIPRQRSIPRQRIDFRLFAGE